MYKMPFFITHGLYTVKRNAYVFAKKFWRNAKAKFPPLITVRISASALLHNFDAWSSLLEKADKPPMIAPVLKSNAYGHGAELVAEILTEKRSDKIPFFVVDSFFEARALRSHSTHLPILIAGYTEARTIHFDNLPDCSYMISSMDHFRDLIKYRIERKGEPTRVFEPVPVSIHIKIDSGMNRQGIKPEEFSDLITLLKICQTSKIIVHGFASHFADSDSADPTKSLEQINVWNNALKELTPFAPHLKYTHISNTGGTYYANQAQANVVRVGGGMYGLTIGATIEDSVPLKLVMSVHTKLYGIKKVKAGETVGYNMTYKAPTERLIALIPLGYNEGIPRELSNTGQVSINGIYCPILGRVSMNITAIDITLASQVMVLNEGDEVCVISNESITLANSLQTIARDAHTITYDIAVHISPLLKRIRVS